FNTGSTTNQKTISILATTTLSANLILTLPTTTPSAGQALTSDANGNLYWATGGGTISGTGAFGYATRWLNTTTLATSTILDNGTVTGINATSSTVSFLVQGTTTLNPFQVNS